MYIKVKDHGEDDDLQQRSRNCICKGPKSKYFRFVGQKVSVTTTRSH